MSKIKIVIADDHAVLRAGLKLLLNNEPDFAVVAEASNGEEVLHNVDTIPCDVLITDLSMPIMGGLECIKELKSRGNPIKILVLTMFEDEQYVKEAMRAGALGYVEKQAVDTELFDAVRTIAKGQRYLSNKNTQVLINSLLTDQPQTTLKDDPYTLLSAREREVLKLIVRGYSMNQIAEKLNLSIKTIDTYKSRFMEKLNISQKSDLVEYAMKHGLLTTQD